MDLIDRQSAIEAICMETCGVSLRKEQCMIHCTEVQAVEKLLPAEPKRETTTVSIGRTRGSITMWYECDACGEPVDKEDAFCRRCGRGLIHE